jgi:hypothetical protein
VLVGALRNRLTAMLMQPQCCTLSINKCNKSREVKSE